MANFKIEGADTCAIDTNMPVFFSLFFSRCLVHTKMPVLLIHNFKNSSTIASSVALISLPFLS